MKTYNSPSTLIAEYRTSYMLLEDVSNGGSILGTQSYKTPLVIN